MVEEYRKKSNSGDDVVIRIANSPAPSAPLPRPTVVLLGWFASQVKHVSKYRVLYENMGYNTIYTSAPFSVVFPINPKTTTLFTLSILRILASDDRLTAGGVVFHMFSNGGAVCAPHLSFMFNGQSRQVVQPDDEAVVKTVKDATAAVVFDSGPVYLRIRLGARAISEGLGVSTPLLSGLILALFALGCILQWLIFIDLPRFFWDGVRQACYPCPELYIYSRADRLLDVSALEKLIAERRSNGFSVNVWTVDDAEHVKIIRNYPDTYQNKLIDMNDSIMNSWRKRHGLSLWNVLRPPNDAEK